MDMDLDLDPDPDSDSDFCAETGYDTVQDESCVLAKSVYVYSGKGMRLLIGAMWHSTVGYWQFNWATAQLITGQWPKANGQRPSLRLGLSLPT
ncbi:unnamed protein product [Kluyveromyces dobzhanskii CBS 2104]|uniref:WGS project CCBQ000000000 data, contig 00102 n=1 Tax=Kluyveromyces dobzhanskii CBS 2104 TaxID=1427455 RepID=A0A0A8L6T4_9SACH|nr:unnamed protein product [Kluyveromyces dobzhanskii CBS 2104]